LIKMAEATGSKVYVDTLISPSYTSSIAQVIQLPGIAGTDNNLLLFEFSKKDPVDLPNIVDNFKLIKAVNFDVLVLGTSERGFGLKKEIHIWITANDYRNANLMILLGYIISGHKEWRGAAIKLFAVFPENSIDEERAKLYELIDQGQLPISTNNVSFITRKPEKDNISIIKEKSRDADLTIVGFNTETIKHQGLDNFKCYDDIGNVLFVNAVELTEIK